jgi:AcrR family transcriptional regulator
VPQRLKDDVRDRILAAAAATFAQQGYLNATMSDIARSADIAPSNIYKYYANKQALFDAVVTPALAARLFRLLRARLREFDTLGSWSDAHADGSARARALLDFWVEERYAVLVLLTGADGTRYAAVRTRMEQEMTRQALRFVRRQTAAAPAPHLEMVLRQVFANTVTMVAAILQRYATAADIAQAFGTFWTYQLAGLEALVRNGKAARAAQRPAPRTAA